MIRAVQLYTFMEYCNNSPLEKEILECGAGISPSLEPLLVRFFEAGYRLFSKRRRPMEKPKVKFITWISDWFRARALFQDYTINHNIPVSTKTGPLDVSDNLNQNMIYSILNGSMTPMENLIQQI